MNSVQIPEWRREDLRKALKELDTCIDVTLEISCNWTDWHIPVPGCGKMKKHHVKRVIVTDDDHRVRGIVARSNLVQVLLQQLP